VANALWEQQHDREWARQQIAGELLQQDMAVRLAAELAEDAEHGYRLRRNDRALRDRAIAGSGVVNATGDQHTGRFAHLRSAPRPQFQAYRILPEPTERPDSCEVGVEARAGLDLIGVYDTETAARSALDTTA
jgi:hypothetical protein